MVDLMGAGVARREDFLALYIAERRGPERVREKENRRAYGVAGMNAQTAELDHRSGLRTRVLLLDGCSLIAGL